MKMVEQRVHKLSISLCRPDAIPRREFRRSG
jgi:hypothetical protein